MGKDARIDSLVVYIYYLSTLGASLECVCVCPCVCVSCLQKKKKLMKNSFLLAACPHRSTLRMYRLGFALLRTVSMNDWGKEHRKDLAFYLETACVVWRLFPGCLETDGGCPTLV